jgi:hypothetical protein
MDEFATLPVGAASVSWRETGDYGIPNRVTVMRSTAWHRISTLESINARKLMVCRAVSPVKTTAQRGDWSSDVLPSLYK